MGIMDQDIIQLLRKYVGNTCNTQELEKVKQILATGSYEQEWKAILQETAEADMADEAEAEDFDAAGVLRRVNSTIRPVKKLNVSRWSIGIAASLLLMLSVGYLFWKKQLQPAKQLPQLSLITGAGQQKKIKLTDGTEVTLNCGSTLYYTATFVGSKREVYLNGEAFFNVTHNPSHPFIVHTGHLNVHVLGTSFNVRSYRADARSTVSVATGKVGVNGTRSRGTYMLLPGEQLCYNKNNSFTKGVVSQDDIMGWQKGMLIFRLENIEEIMPVLERYYGVSIHIKKSHDVAKQVTARFAQKTLPQVLEILSQTAGFKYDIIKNDIYIN